MSASGASMTIANDQGSGNMRQAEAAVLARVGRVSHPDQGDLQQTHRCGQDLVLARAAQRKVPFNLLMRGKRRAKSGSRPNFSVALLWSSRGDRNTAYDHGRPVPSPEYDRVGRGRSTPLPMRAEWPGCGSDREQSARGSRVPRDRDNRSRGRFGAGLGRVDRRWTKSSEPAPSIAFINMVKALARSGLGNAVEVTSAPRLVL